MAGNSVRRARTEGHRDCGVSVMFGNRVDIDAESRGHQMRKGGQTRIRE
jgi:hypothetical protein